MIYKLGYNLPKAEINKRIMAYEANQAEITQLKAKLELCRDALTTIAYPIQHLQKVADEQGASLNGMAAMLVDDARYLKQIAKEALAAIEGRDEE